MAMIHTGNNKMTTSNRRRRRRRIITSGDPLLLSLGLLLVLSCALPMKATTTLFVDGFSFVKVRTTHISPITRTSAGQHFIDTITCSRSSSSSSSSSSLVQLFASNNDNDDENNNSNNGSNSFFDGKFSLKNLPKLPSVFSSSSSNNSDDDNDDITGVIDNDDESSSKFDMAQRIESLKSIVLGALAGGIGLTPIAYLHYVYFAAATESNGLAQWEFVTDMSSIEAGK